MKVTGITAEFDPFHNGHKYLLDLAAMRAHKEKSGGEETDGEKAIGGKGTDSEKIADCKGTDGKGTDGEKAAGDEWTDGKGTVGGKAAGGKGTVGEKAVGGKGTGGEKAVDDEGAEDGVRAAADEKIANDTKCAIMVVMSGAFTQRGMPSFYDKRLRVEAALRNGADLVVELPYVYACNTADIFAEGSIRTMADCGAVDNIFFGRECKDENLLVRAAKIIEMTEPDIKINAQISERSDDSYVVSNSSDFDSKPAGYSGSDSDSVPDVSGPGSNPDDDLIAAFQSSFRSLLKRGLSYPAALSKAAGETFGQEIERELKSPNNILAIRYINAVRKYAPHMAINSILRKGEGHSSESETCESEACESNGYEACESDGYEVCESDGYEACESVERRDNDFSMISGSKIRKAVSKGEKEILRSSIPASVYDIFSGKDFCLPGDDFYRLLRYRIITSAKHLKDIYSVSEGIENRLLEAAYSSETFEEFISGVRTRRYTDARLMRMFSHILMNFTYEDYDEIKDVSYLRVLGFTDRGAKILSDIKKNSEITIISNLSKLRYLPEKVKKSLKVDMRAADVRNMIMGRNLKDYSERKYKPVKI